MTVLFEKSIQTLELPRVLEWLAEQAVTEEGKDRCLALRPLTDADDDVRRFTRKLFRDLRGDALCLLRQLKQAGHAHPNARTAPVRFREMSLAQCADLLEMIQNPVHMLPFPASLFLRLRSSPQIPDSGRRLARFAKLFGCGAGIARFIAVACFLPSCSSATGWASAHTPA